MKYCSLTLLYAPYAMFLLFYKSQDAHGVLEKHSVKMGSYVLVGLRTCCINCCKKFDLEAEINKHFKENILCPPVLTRGKPKARGLTLIALSPLLAE